MTKHGFTNEAGSVCAPAVPHQTWNQEHRDEWIFTYRR